ncbi:hypothetical protein [Estrella lausannensis]|nr:hypothetical protein [Estrella lausannensis]
MTPLSLSSGWNCPSDHLPVGVTLESSDLPKPISVISWNILNSLWIPYIEQDAETNGMKESAILKLDRIIEGTSYTERELKVNELIQSILWGQMQRGRSPILLLQEVSTPMRKLIEKDIPQQLCILATDPGFNDLGLVIYDQEILVVEEYEVIHGLYSRDRDNFVQDVIFSIRGSEQRLRIINTHIPGGEGSCGPQEFSSYLQATFKPGMPTLAAGDMNVESPEVDSALKEAFNGASPFAPVVQSYGTYINSSNKLLQYDQILFSLHQVDSLNAFPLDPTGIEGIVADYLSGL